MTGAQSAGPIESQTTPGDARRPDNPSPKFEVQPNIVIEEFSAYQEGGLIVRSGPGSLAGPRAQQFTLSKPVSFRIRVANRGKGNWGKKYYLAPKLNTNWR